MGSGYEKHLETHRIRNLIVKAIELLHTASVANGGKNMVLSVSGDYMSVCASNETHVTGLDPKMPGSLANNMAYSRQAAAIIPITEGEAMSGLHVFRTEEDWVIASDEEDAWKIFSETYGTSVEKAKLDYDGMTWERLDDDKVVYVWEESPSGVCFCNERKAEQKAAADACYNTRRKIIEHMQDTSRHDEGSPIWCMYSRFAQKVVPERKVTTSHECYRGCPNGWPGMTCRQWAKKVGRGALASTDI